MPPGLNGTPVRVGDMTRTRKNDWQGIAKRMAELRQQHRRSQQEAAAALGIAQTSYSDMERGMLRIRRRDLVTLAEYYGVPLEEAFPSFRDSVEAVA